MKGIFLKKISFISLFFFFAIQVFAQDEDYDKELTYGINLNTNAGLIGGFMFKYAKRRDEGQFNTLTFELVNIKHPKEMRYPSPITGNTFVFGKQNYLFSFRMQYGRDIILFYKAPEKGVKVSAVLAGGFSLGIAKPYQILYQYGPNDVRSEAYNPDTHRFIDAILGTGGFFEGFGDARFIPGVNAKIGASLDFGTFKNSITGFEAGFNFEAFTEKVILVPAASNNQFFTGVYLTIFFGSRK